MGWSMPILFAVFVLVSLIWLAKTFLRISRGLATADTSSDEEFVDFQHCGPGKLVRLTFHGPARPLLVKVTAEITNQLHVRPHVDLQNQAIQFLWAPDLNAAFVNEFLNVIGQMDGLKIELLAVADSPAPINS